MLDVSAVKKDFPILGRQISGKPLVYLDSTASSLKPRQVLEAMEGYYKNYSANIFRGVYHISEEATAAYEDARKNIARFINTPDEREIVFVRNATEAINLVAATWGRSAISSGDEIVTGVMEHHANIVPWQQLSLESGGILKIVDINRDGTIHWRDIKNLRPRRIGLGPKKSNIEDVITKKTKLLAITHISNVLGTINPIKQIVARVKHTSPSCVVLVDAAQSVPHRTVDVRDMGCDFLVFSGHKMLGPTGIGVLWGKYGLLSRMPPYQTGGEMIREVSISGSTFKDTPHKFEAGTPHIAGAIGLSAAVDYLSNIGMVAVQDHERSLTEYALRHLSNLGYLKIFGPTKSEQRAGVIAFSFTGIHPHDLAQILDRDNICIRSGHHCAMPLHTHLGITATARASFYVYNTLEDIDALMVGIEKARKIFINK